MLSPFALVPRPASLAITILRYVPQVTPRDISTYTLVLDAFVLCSIYLYHIYSAN